MAATRSILRWALGWLQAPGEITEEETIEGSAATGNITLPSWSPATDELVLLALSCRDTSQTPSPAGNGYTFVEVENVLNTQSQFKMWLWRAMKDSPSTGSIVITLSGNTDPAVATATRFSGVDNGGTHGATAVEVSGTNVGPNPDDDDMLDSITTVTNNAWAYAAGSHRLETFTVPGGETALSINNSEGAGGDTTSISTWYQETPTAGSTQLGAAADLGSDTDWSMILASIKPTGGAAPTPGDRIKKRLLRIGTRQGAQIGT